MRLKKELIDTSNENEKYKNKVIGSKKNSATKTGIITYLSKNKFYENFEMIQFMDCAEAQFSINNLLVKSVLELSFFKM